MSDRLVIGSDEHKNLFCRTLIDTHIPYDPGDIVWPAIDARDRTRIAALPFWPDAMRDEINAMRKLEALAARQHDPLLAEALALQGREEGRHGRIIGAMLRAYGIAVEPMAPAIAPRDAEWAYIKLGYGECFDSFFAFGMFHLAGNAGFFPPALVEVFEPIVQEEARHILFFQNWISYVRANRPAGHRAVHRLTSARALALSVWSRMRIGLALKRANRGHAPAEANFPVERFSLRGFLEACLAENARRLSPYDARLLRPRLIPALATAAVGLLPASGPGGTGEIGARPA
ncbi:MAG: ferritin-like domain-containing protein [Alphaproteobacteria bacterium]|nr:ferritin-like domain-containing protein [Alphaproteobacteria bacterium]